MEAPKGDAAGAAAAAPAAAAPAGDDAAGGGLERQLSAHGAKYEGLLAKGVPRHMLARAWVVCAGDAAEAEMYIQQNADQPPSFWRVTI
eukprot:COSAG02_NODE_54219_length_297_cov_0.848485_1_plen_89_part_10